MSRILLLFVFLLWMSATQDPRPAGNLSVGGVWPSQGMPVALFLWFYVFLVVGMGLWARSLARRVALPNLHRRLQLFNTSMFAARVLVVAWFGYGVFLLGWAEMVEHRWGMAALGALRLPGLLVGTCPALLAWAGLWWSQYPADRALREQNLLSDLDGDLPLHHPPSFGSYLAMNLRVQLLFAVVPVLLIALVHDVAVVPLAGLLPADRLDWESADAMLWLGASALVFVVAPLVLRRILKTTSLPESPLRRRLENLSRRGGMRCRDILVWHTDHNMGNAAVMGVIPQVRYVLLSDVLLETMDDDQIEAVFAHEVGHVVHRHMTWFVVFFVALILAMGGLETHVGPTLDRLGQANGTAVKLATLVAGTALFTLAFGLLSRRFERQADVYAARTIQRSRHFAPAGPGSRSPVGLTLGSHTSHGAGGILLGAHHLVASGGGTVAGVLTSGMMGAEPPGHDGGGSHHDEADPAASHVGRHGAALFGSALHRVAIVNNIPIEKNELLHGSIASRMRFLRDLSEDPGRTDQFDRVMGRLYCLLLIALCATGTWMFFLFA